MQKNANNLFLQGFHDYVQVKKSIDLLSKNSFHLKFMVTIFSFSNDEIYVK